MWTRQRTFTPGHLAGTLSILELLAFLGLLFPSSWCRPGAAFCAAVSAVVGPAAGAAIIANVDAASVGVAFDTAVSAAVGAAAIGAAFGAAVDAALVLGSGSESGSERSESVGSVVLSQAQLSPKQLE